LVEHLEQLVRSHGYWALFVGTFLEGETPLILGGLCAKLGLLQLPVVIVIAFIGSFFGDQIWFFIGYFKGREILSKHPKWAKRADRVHTAIKRYRTLIMLGFRFIYGMRIMTPFVIGLDREITIVRFFVLNAMGAVLWSVVGALAGYFFGYALQGFVKNIRKYEIHALIIVSIIGLLLWAIHKYRSNKQLP
jgi:membrane protein DedA with SNARE-associated domain